MSTKRPRILVVGSFVMDLIVKADRLPGDGETIIGKSFKMFPGGKGFNQAVQAARLGAQVEMVGCLGNDANGEVMLEAAKKEGIGTAHIRIADDISTAVGNVQLFTTTGGVQNRIIVVPGANMRLTTDDVAFLADEASNFDAVLLQLEIPMEVNEAVAAYAAAANVPVMLNPAPSAVLSDVLLGNIDCILPNETEAAQLSGIPIARGERGLDPSDVRKAAVKLMERGVKQVLVTLGNAGSAYYAKEVEITCPIVPEYESVDPTAAGDSYIGAFTVAKSAGYSVSQSMQIASMAAGVTVSRMGGFPALPRAEEIGFIMR